MKWYTWNALCIRGWHPLSFSSVKSPHLWSRTEVVPGCRWLFGVDHDGKALMVNLDNGTHYDLFRTDHPRDPDVYLISSFPSRKMFILNSGSLFLAVTRAVGISTTIPASMKLSTAILLQQRLASLFIKWITQSIAILQSTHLTSTWEPDLKMMKSWVPLQLP